jgi:superfamily II DNA or RNA helicase
MLRLFLPPNLASAAPRDAIPIKIELTLDAAPPPEWLPALALLQRWSLSSTPPKFLQINRSQLRTLIASLKGQPVFYFLNGPSTPIAWNDEQLSGVSILLTPPATPTSLARNGGGGSEKPKFQPRATATPLTVDGSEHFLAITLPSREHPRYADALALLKEAGFTLEPSNRTWWLRDRHKTLNFLAAQGDRLRGAFGAVFTENFEKRTTHLRPAEIACDAVESAGGFDLTLGLKAGGADDSQLRGAVAANRGYLEVGGKIFLLDSTKLAQLATAQRALAGDPQAPLAPRRTHRVTAARVAEAQEIIEALSPGFQPPDAWRQRGEALRNLSRLAAAPLPSKLEGLLRPYQRLGAAWLWHLHRSQLGGILADEMGLGKTLQALALLLAVNQAPAAAPSENKSGRAPFKPSSAPSLVVCPASLLENWRREAARFAPELTIFVHHGDHRLSGSSEFSGINLIVTSYGTLTRDWEMFAAVEFACVIADEAQHIKNRRSQNAAALRSLKAGSRFLLTGTPVENSFDDLRSLFEFLLPGYIDKVPTGTRADERQWFDDRLRAKVAPYILRRTKQAVAPELPAKLEHIIWCEFTPAQAKLYRETQERTERELFDLEAGGASEGSLRFAALTQLLRLRQICCDPRLINSQAAPFSENVEESFAPKASTETAPFSDSAKLEAFRELLAEAVDDGHRILVFSQFTSLLRLLQEELSNQQTGHCYLDGSMTPRARQAEVDRFQASPDIPVFLISLKAGGTGLNLTGADTVVHFDPWWNPAAEAQATDRAHRIGQTRVVTSYKLIASGSVEEKVLALQDEKRALLAGVFEASAAAAEKLSLSDLKSLLG